MWIKPKTFILYFRIVAMFLVLTSRNLGFYWIWPADYSISPKHAQKKKLKKNKVCFGAPAGEISAAVSDSRWSTYTAAHNGSSTAPFQTAMLLRRGHNIVLAAIGAEGCLLDYSGVRRDAVTVYTLSGWICHGWFCLRDFRRPRRRANQRDVTSIPQLSG